MRNSTWGGSALGVLAVVLVVIVVAWFKGPEEWGWKTQVWTGTCAVAALTTTWLITRDKAAWTKLWATLAESGWWKKVVITLAAACTLAIWSVVWTADLDWTTTTKVWATVGGVAAPTIMWSAMQWSPAKGWAELWDKVRNPSWWSKLVVLHLATSVAVGLWSVAWTSINGTIATKTLAAIIGGCVIAAAWVAVHWNPQRSWAWNRVGVLCLALSVLLTWCWWLV